MLKPPKIPKTEDCIRDNFGKPGSNIYELLTNPKYHGYEVKYIDYYSRMIVLMKTKNKENPQ